MAELLHCPFCGETARLRVADLQIDARGEDFAVYCECCETQGPIDRTPDQAIANWNRRPASTLADACPIGNFDEMDGTWDGVGDQRTVWWNRGVVDGLRTAQRVVAAAIDSPTDTTVEALQRSIEHHERQARSTLAYEVNTGAALASTDHHARLDWQRFPGIASAAVDNSHAPIVEAPSDELAQAREKRELSGLPTLETTVDDTGVSMDFDLGGPKKR